MARVVTELMGCVDCLMYVANGDLPESDSDAGVSFEASIVATAGVASGLICCGDSELDEEFSWSACECCGSRLGGSRHQLIILGE